MHNYAHTVLRKMTKFENAIPHHLSIHFFFMHIICTKVESFAQKGWTILFQHVLCRLHLQRGLEWDFGGNNRQ